MEDKSIPLTGNTRASSGAIHWDWMVRSEDIGNRYSKDIGNTSAWQGGRLRDGLGWFPLRRESGWAFEEPREVECYFLRALRRATIAMIPAPSTARRT